MIKLTVTTMRTSMDNKALNLNVHVGAEFSPTNLLFGVLRDRLDNQRGKVYMDT